MKACIGVDIVDRLWVYSDNLSEERSDQSYSFSDNEWSYIEVNIIVK